MTIPSRRHLQRPLKRAGTRHQRRLTVLAVLLVLTAAYTISVIGHGSRSGLPSGAGACTVPAAAPAGGPAPATRRARTVRLSGLPRLRLVSYYPSTAAWTSMWSNWQPQRINADFAAIHALGANAVRIIVQPSALGFPRSSPGPLAELRQTVALASHHGLAAQLTLFDWWQDYPNRPGSDTWARSVLQPYHDNPNIAFIEVKNEINPDSAQAMTWLRHELPAVQRLAGSIPVTVSVSGINPLQQLAALHTALAPTPPDFYDLHFYGPAASAQATFTAARTLVAPAQLYIGETGAPSTEPDPINGEHSQDLYLRTVEWAAAATGLPPAAPWIFQDITPTGVPQDHTKDSAQLSFGLLRTDGTTKPAAASIRSAFLQHHVSTTFNNGFEMGSDRLPADWTPQDPEAGTESWDPNVGHSAPGSVVLRRTRGTPQDSPSWSVAPVLQPTTASEQFRMTAWTKSAKATGHNRIAIAWFDLCGHYLSENDSAALPPGTADWRQLTVDSTAPPHAAYQRLYLKSAHNNGTIWYDDVTLTRTPSIQTPTGPTAASPP